MQAKTMLFSVYGFPLLGLTGLLVCLWHPQMSLKGDWQQAGHRVSRSAQPAP